MLNSRYNPSAPKNPSQITGLYLVCLLIGMSTVVTALPLIRLSWAKEAPVASNGQVQPADTSLKTLQEKGQMLFVSRKFAAATETYELLVSKYPQEVDLPEIYSRLVTLYENQQDYVNAARSIERGYQAAVANNDGAFKQTFVQMAQTCRCQVNLKG